MRNLFHPATLKSAILLGILAAATHIVSAQALITAQRGAEITPFAQATLISPDWGQTNNLGYTFGIDFTRFIRSSFLQPSLELRMNSAGGITVLERSYVGGFKLQTAIHGIHPYATILGGDGSITFTHPINGYLGDNSFVLSVGCGAEFNVTRQLAVRLDFTNQFWNLDPQSLTPLTFGVGVAYHIGARNSRIQ
jgi:hypothetical protein